MNKLNYLKYFIFLIGFVVLDAQAQVELQGIIETAYYECENLGTDAMAIQSIRYEQDSPIQELMETLTLLVEKELGPQPLFLHRIKAVAQWVYFYYPPDFDPDLVGQTYAGECKNKTFGQIQLLVENGKGQQQGKTRESTRQLAR